MLSKLIVNFRNTHLARDFKEQFDKKFLTKVIEEHNNKKETLPQNRIDIRNIKPQEQKELEVNISEKSQGYKESYDSYFDSLPDKDKMKHTGS